MATQTHESTTLNPDPFRMIARVATVASSHFDGRCDGARYDDETAHQAYHIAMAMVLDDDELGADRWLGLWRGSRTKGA